MDFAQLVWSGIYDDLTCDMSAKEVVPGAHDFVLKKRKESLNKPPDERWTLARGASAGIVLLIDVVLGRMSDVDKSLVYGILRCYAVLSHWVTEEDSERQVVEDCRDLIDELGSDKEIKAYRRIVRFVDSVSFQVEDILKLNGE